MPSLARDTAPRKQPVAGRRRPARRRLPRIGIVLLLGLIAVIAVGLIGAIGRQSAEERAVADVVNTFVDAREAKNGALACAQMTRAAQRDLVALVKRVPASRASAADCPRYVVSTSPRSRFTKRDLSGFAGGGPDVSVQRVKQGDKKGDLVARAHPKHSSSPELEAWHRDGEWKLDGFAYFGAGVVLGCESGGQSRRFCQCMLDALREGNPGSPNRLLGRLTGLRADVKADRRSRLLEQARSHCQS